MRCAYRDGCSDKLNDARMTASNSIVVYLRLLTSAQIRADPDAYAGFLMHPEIGEPMELRDFCESFVEAVGKEAGMFARPDAL